MGGVVSPIPVPVVGGTGQRSDVPAGRPDPDPRPDLDSRAAIHDLVVGFYREIIFDEVLGPVFDEVAEVDWTVHLPRLVDYWCRVLLGQPGYDGAILAPHRHVHELDPFTPELFDRWYELWVRSIDRRWSGPIADQAKSHARRVARMLSRQLNGVDREPGAPDPEATIPT